MNLLILLLIVLITIANPWAGLGILTALALIYFVLANNDEKRNIEKKLSTWSWYDWRV